MLTTISEKIDMIGMSRFFGNAYHVEEIEATGMKKDVLLALQSLSKEARRLLVQMIAEIGVGHVGGSLSIIEALVYLYYKELRVRPEEPRWSDRDRFILSKGHAGPALYALLAMKGYFDKETLRTLNQSGTTLPSHCDMNLTTGIDMTAGSLGQGLSAAVGMALAARMDKKDYRVYCIVGDGESQEGQVWEAAMYAGSQELDNLVLLVDDNGMQIDGYTDELNTVRPLDKRLAAFGWATMTIDGHNFEELESALNHCRTIKKRPSAIIMNTVKGKGLSLAEGKVSSHNMPFSAADLTAALKELE